jgi:predicted transcriptional regulator
MRSPELVCADMRPIVNVALRVDMDQKPASNIESTSETASEHSSTSQGIDTKWEESLVEVMREVIFQLPEETSLGEIVAAARNNPYFSRVLRHISVKDLIVLACERPSSQTKNPSVEDSDAEDGDSSALEIGTAAVIRRRADVPNGDSLVLRYLAEHGPQGELAIGRGTQLTSDQVRLLVRSLNAKGLIHSEGAGAKKKIRITRNGQGFLRHAGQNSAASSTRSLSQ